MLSFVLALSAHDVGLCWVGYWNNICAKPPKENINRSSKWGVHDWFLAFVKLWTGSCDSGSSKHWGGGGAGNVRLDLGRI